MHKQPIAAQSIPEQQTKTIYPQPFTAVVEGRIKRKLGDFFGLTNYGVNLTSLEPGSASALLHHHAKQDEFIYILSGTPTLILGDQEYEMKPGECFGFKAGNKVGHQLVNKSTQPVTYLEIGDRTVGDEVAYPNDDLKAVQLESGQWQLTHKDGSPY